MSEILAVDVSTDFIGAVADHVRKRFEKGTQHLTVLFPNRRAVRFFEARLVSPLLLDIEVYALEDYALKTVSALSVPPPAFQMDMDRYFMLHDILQHHPFLYQHLGGSVEHVFPWCIHLSNLFDEFDRHLISTVAPLQYIEEVVPQAREILLHLDTLYKGYRENMERANLTYHGDIFRRLNSLKESLTGTFILAGFSLLTRAQKAFFTYLLKNRETTILFHTDLTGRHKGINPYRIYTSWMNSTYWGEKPAPYPAKLREPPPSRTVFFESFDSHAEAHQLVDTLQRVLDKTRPIRSPLEVGVVLPDSQALFPVIYPLTSLETPMNVTLGFPFERSVFYTLLLTLINLVLTRHATRGFYHIPFVSFLSHPFIQSLVIDGTPFAETSRRLQDEIIRHNLPFIKLDDLKNTTDLSIPDLKLCEKLHARILLPFSRARTMFEAGEVLERLIRGFKEAVSSDPDFMLERQMIQNFLDKVMPHFTLAKTSKRRLPSPEILCRTLRHLLIPLHIPFEGNPLEGLQIMGMLESRLLNFTHLFVLDVNEGILPRPMKIDPLLPPSLHPLIGLPSVKEREALFQYHFFRLVDSSKNAYIFFQKGETGEDKKIRSRFVEQLLLEVEIKQSKRKQTGDIDRLETSLIHTFPLQIPPFPKPEVPRKPSFFNVRLEKCLTGGISPTLLDEYLHCPYRFYLHRILNMEEETIVQEQQDPLNVGKIIHGILQHAFMDCIGTNLTRPLLKKTLQKTLNQIAPSLRTTFPTLSPLRIRLLEHLVHHRINAFFTYAEKDLETYHDIRIIDIEKTMTAELEGYVLKGKADRIDAIHETPDSPQSFRIIDYKTGQSARTPSKDFLKFFKNFDLSDYTGKALSDLRKRLGSIQLPLYTYLFKKTSPLNGAAGVDAILLTLGKAGGNIASKPYHGERIPSEIIETLMLYLIHHMRHSERLIPIDSSHCPYCPYIKVCKHTLHSKASLP